MVGPQWETPFTQLKLGADLMVRKREVSGLIPPTTRMSHEEERVNGVRMRNKPERAPPHWLNPLCWISGSGLPPTQSKIPDRQSGSQNQHRRHKGPAEMPEMAPC
jgi:hypothetical protein